MPTKAKTSHPISPKPPRHRPAQTQFFSIIVPAYNVADYLPQCISSVLSQTFQGFELILVDDGSSDHTGAICDQYNKTRSVKVIHQPNAGLSAARNTGVRAASGEYLLFLDGDDYLEPDALAVIHDSIQSTSSASGTPLDLLRFQAQEVFTASADQNSTIVKTIPHPEASFGPMVGVEAFCRLTHCHYVENAWLYAYRRSFFISNHFQYAPGCISEDFGLTPLVIARAQSVCAIPDICYSYRQRLGSIQHGAASTARRAADISRQLDSIIPRISEIPDSAPILHFLIVSFLTSATLLNYADFQKVYQNAKSSGWFRYISPDSLRALPRAIMLKHSPQLFYRFYRRELLSNHANHATDMV